MAEKNSPATATQDRELVITRVFDTPRRLVFEAWTKPEHLMRWWGPRGFTLPVCEMNLRPGGAYRFVMRGPDGKDYPMQGVYREIVEPERIVFTATLDDEPPGHEILTKVTFAEQEGKTKLTVHQTYYKMAMRRGAQEGWTQSLDRLTDYLAKAKK